MRRSRLRSTPRLSMTNHFMRDQPRHLGKLFPKKRNKTGAIVESRVPTGALKRSPKISTRELSIKRDLCSPNTKRRSRDGATRVSAQRTGAMKRSRPRSTPRQLMTNHFMRDQPRHPGKLSPRKVSKLRDGAIRESDPRTGATRKSRLKSIPRLWMINLCTRDQPRLLGNHE
jgi:hypothetical protein